MTDLDLSSITARANAATPGPWAITDGPTNNSFAIREGSDGFLILTVWRDDNPRLPEADATFIAAARSDIPALVAEIERLRNERPNVQAGGEGGIGRKR